MQELTLILITTDRERTIVATLDSVRNNRSEILKIRLYDFASSDNTVKIVKNYIKEYKLAWQYEILPNALRNCEDWQFALEKEPPGWITFLEGDDCWPDNFVGNFMKIVRDFPSVGLIHFSGTNENGYFDNGYESDTLYSGDEYICEHLAKRISGNYAPSQTIFKKVVKTEFDFKRFQYAPEPRLWLDLSKQCDVYICRSVAVYRGISSSPTIKLYAILDLLEYSVDLIKFRPVFKWSVIFQLTRYMFKYHYAAYFLSVIKRRQRLTTDFIVKPLTAYLNMYGRI